jgi:Ca2+-binding EF-hand superfamily protein
LLFLDEERLKLSFKMFDNQGTGEVEMIDLKEMFY